MSELATALASERSPIEVVVSCEGLKPGLWVSFWSGITYLESEGLRAVIHNTQAGLQSMTMMPTNGRDTCYVLSKQWQCCFVSCATVAITLCLMLLDIVD